MHRSPYPTDELHPKPGERIVEVKPDGPIPTPAAARDLLRRRSATERLAPVRVLIHAGDYYLDEPLAFNPDDSGGPDAPVIYAGAPGARPRISGGIRLTGWTVTEHRGLPCWELRLASVATGDVSFSRIFVNGEIRERTRLPREGYYRFRDPAPGLNHEQALYFPGDMRADWVNPGDVNVVALNYWTDSHLRVRSVDENSGTVYFMAPCVRYLLDERGAGGARYYIENVSEAMTEPGDWYLDRTTGILRYLPKPGEDPETAEVIAPRLAELLHVEGAPDRPVRDLHFVNLDWQHAEWRYPSDYAGPSQAACTVPGALVFLYAHECSLRLSRVRGVNGYAVEVGAGGDARPLPHRPWRTDEMPDTGVGSRSVTIAGNIFEDLGAGGVKAWTGSSATCITDNRIRRGGRIFRSAVGVLVADSPDNAILHNEIFDFFYTGVSVGWTWGFQPSRTFRNRIERNHIHRIGQGVLSDMGGIYTLGLAPGMRVCHNRIHEVRCYGYGGQGIYPDEGTAYALYEDNVVSCTDTGGFGMNYGRDNVVRNNIFAWGRDQQIKWNTVRNYRPFVFEGNIVLWDEGALTGGAGGATVGRLPRFDRNLYGGPPVFTVGARSWPAWTASGRDVEGRVADPMFVDARAGDFRLRSDSPASAMGFRPIDMTRFGPRAAILATGTTPADLYRPGPCAWARIEVGGGNAGNQGNPLIGAWPEQAPCRFSASVLLHNAGDEEFHGPVTATVTTEGGAGEARAFTREVRLNPDTGDRIEFEIDAPGGTTEVTIEVSSPEKGFWGSVLILPFRPTLRCPALPEDVGLVRLSEMLADAPASPVATEDGVPLGTVRVGLAGARIALVADIVAARRIRNPARPAGGTFLTLLSREREAGTYVTGRKGLRSLLLIPEAGGLASACLRSTMDPAPGCDIEVSDAPGGFQVRALVVTGELSIDPTCADFALKVIADTYVAGVDHRLRGATFGFNDLSFIQSYGRYVTGVRRCHSEETGS